MNFLRISIFSAKQMEDLLFNVKRSLRIGQKGSAHLKICPKTSSLRKFHEFVPCAYWGRGGVWAIWP